MANHITILFCGMIYHRRAGRRIRFGLFEDLFSHGTQADVIYHVITGGGIHRVSIRVLASIFSGEAQHKKVCVSLCGLCARKI